MTNKEIENIYVANEFPTEKRLYDLVKLEFPDAKRSDIGKFL